MRTPPPIMNWNMLGIKPYEHVIDSRDEAYEVKIRKALPLGQRKSIKAIGLDSGLGESKIRSWLRQHGGICHGAGNPYTWSLGEMK